MAGVREWTYSTAFYGGFSETDLIVWRFVRDEGGYWTATELLQQLPGLSGSAQGVAGTLKRLYSAGHMSRRGTAPIRYGVTTTCQAPPSESMRLSPTRKSSLSNSQGFDQAASA